MYTRSALLIKSAVLLFLIYYATIGLSIWIRGSIPLRVNHLK
jgi:hypothetical protein